MRKRDERRNRIEAAFKHLRATFATVLGAADNRYAQVLADSQRQRFALRIAQEGVTSVLRDPESVCAEPDPGFSAALREAVAERDAVYRTWTEQGPQQLNQLVAAAAPGCASAPWQEWLGKPGVEPATGNVPGLWRIGEATVPDAPEQQPFPAAVPLLDESHLRISTHPDSAGAAEALVQNLLMRVLSYFQPGLVRVHVWDALQLTGSLPGLYPLTRAGLLTVHDPERLDELLEVLSDHIRRIHTNALLNGHPSLRALAAETGHRSEPWRIAVLFGNREALKEEQQQQLQRIARSGLACGSQLIVVDVSLSANSPVETVELDSSGTARTSMTGPHALVRLDEALPRGEVLQACSEIAEGFLAHSSRVRTFQDLLPQQLWQHRSTSGLQAPVGFSEGDPVWISLGDASPHMLIGGPSGSGKTNFIYSMLGGLTARYSPDELELYLLDFKEGVSFAQFTPGRRDPSWLPHARLVGVNVNTDREFGLALLQFLAREMRRRAAAAKEHEVTKLEELRAEDPQGRWPRIVAVIDEFQYLFAERDPVTAQATALLEDVARRGRSQGIHLVLASQDVSGIEAFWGKPAIFEQFIVRVALPKARRVLNEHNQASLDLPRWHAVVNHESGVKHGNQVARIPDATGKDTFEVLQRRMWLQRDEQQPPPRLFDGALLPKLSALEDFDRLRAPSPAPRAVLGQTIDVDGAAAAVQLSRAPGRNIAVLGSVRREAASVLGAALLSLARQHAPGDAELTVAALLPESAEDAQQVTDVLRRQGHQVGTATAAEFPALLSNVVRSLEDRSGAPHFLFLYGVDAVHSSLEQKDPQTRVSGLDEFRRLLRQGPEHGVHVIGWWRSVQRLKAALGMTPVDDIGAWLAFDVQGHELTQFAAGQPVKWSPRPHRGLFFDRSVHARPEVVLPLELDVTGGPVVPHPRLSDTATGGSW